MPALLLHMTCAREAAADPARGGPLAEAARAEDAALLLGSVLPDLPYHDRFAGQVALHLLRRPYLRSTWGDLLHRRGTGALGLALLAHARRAHLAGPARRRVLALTAGYLSHYALDTVVHPAIQERVAAARAAGDAAPAEVIHADVERIQCAFYHLDRCGHPLAGSPYPREITRAMAGAGDLRPRLPRDLGDAVRAAFIEIHGRAPAARTVGRWLRGVTHYGRLMSSPLGRRSEGLRGDLGALRRARYAGPRVDLAAPVAAAIRRTHAVWRAAEALLRAERIDADARAAYAHAVPDVDLDTGG